MSISVMSLPIDQIDLIKPLWEALRDDHGRKSPYFSSDFFNRHFEQRYTLYNDSTRVKKAFVFVAKDDVHIVGYSAGHVTTEMIGEIDSLFVLPAYRARGVGHSLVSILKTAINDFSAIKTRLKVIVGNEDVLPFYAKHGFYAISYELQDNTSQSLTFENDNTSSTHDKFMRRALYWANKAKSVDEAPIGCVIVHNGKIIANGYNLREAKQDVTLHAEMCAIRSACKKLGSWRLEDCDMYVTLEPCTMCAGAIIQSRIRHVYFGAKDPKSGAVISTQRLFDLKHNHQVGYTGGILDEKCGQILKDFFQNLRTKKKARQE